MALLLGLAVLAAWLGALGAARLRGPLDRLHAVAFVNLVPGAAVAAAAFASDGLSARALKVLLVVLLSWIIGAALAHATGRALLRRHAAGQGEAP